MPPPKRIHEERGIVKFYMDNQIYKEFKFNDANAKKLAISRFKKTTKNISYRIQFRYEIIHQ